MKYVQALPRAVAIQFHGGVEVIYGIDSEVFAPYPEVLFSCKGRYGRPDDLLLMTGPPKPST